MSETKAAAGHGIDREALRVEYKRLADEYEGRAHVHGVGAYNPANVTGSSDETFAELRAARDALDGFVLTLLASAGAGGERTDDALGWVVEFEHETGWIRRARSDRSMVWPKEEAEAERDALVEDGVSARIRPVVVALAPAAEPPTGRIQDDAVAMAAVRTLLAKGWTADDVERAWAAEPPGEAHRNCGCCSVLHEVREIVAGVPGETVPDSVRTLVAAWPGEVREPDGWVPQVRLREYLPWQTVWSMTRKVAKHAEMLIESVGVYGPNQRRIVEVYLRTPPAAEKCGAADG